MSQSLLIPHLLKKFGHRKRDCFYHHLTVLSPINDQLFLSVVISCNNSAECINDHQLFCSTSKHIVTGVGYISPEMCFLMTWSDLWPSLFHQALLFNPAKPFWRGTGSQNADVELMMDCFVSCFRINPHNNQHFKVDWKEWCPFIVCNVSLLNNMEEIHNVSSSS